MFPSHRLHTFLNGRYLNQELVDEGFAKIV